MKRWFSYGLIILLLFTGCSHSTLNNEKGEAERNMNETVLKANKVKIIDIVENMYEQSIAVNLSEKESAEIIDSLGTLTEKTSGYSRGLLYSISLYNADNEQVNRFFVDTGDTIGDINGNYYQRNEKISAVLSKVEKEFNLTPDALWNRKPGKNYFGALQMTDHGTLREITDNNFIEGISVDFSDSDIKTFISKLSNVSFSDSFYDFEYDQEHILKYVMHFYTNAGGEVYMFYVDSDLNVYAEQGYKLINADLSSWIKDVINE